jgi:hypothetical protein
MPVPGIHSLPRLLRRIALKDGGDRRAIAASQSSGRALAA